MEENWVIETCCNCHVPFKITAVHQDHLKQSHKEFYCPNGHSLYYPGETEAEKLEKELEYKQNHIKRLYDENENNLEKITDLKKELKDTTEKKVQEPSKQDNRKVVKKTIKKTNQKGRQYEVFDKSQLITKINNVAIGQPIVDYLSEKLPTGKFKIDAIRALINQLYTDKLKRSINKKSVEKYAWVYKKYLLATGLIVDLGNGNYQLKVGGESVELDLPPKKPPAKLSALENWLINKNSKKPFDIEQFYNACPEQRQHKKHVEDVLSELCAKGVIIQLSNNRYRLPILKTEEEK